VIPARALPLVLLVGVHAAACTSWVTLGDLPLDPSDAAPGDATAGPDAAIDGAADTLRPPYLPCAGKVCGASCTVCDPSDTTCSETADVKTCDTAGACRGGAPSCDATTPPPYDPCEGKTCGSSCTLCRPGDGSCVETAVLKVCNKAGTCQSGAPGC